VNIRNKVINPKNYNYNSYRLISCASTSDSKFVQGWNDVGVRMSWRRPGGTISNGGASLCNPPLVFLSVGANRLSPYPSLQESRTKAQSQENGTERQNCR
jgi:hypothetical protein